MLMMYAPYGMQGRKTVDSLSYYYHQHKEDLDADSKNEYKRLYRRLKTVCLCNKVVFTFSNGYNEIVNFMSFYVLFSHCIRRVTG